MKKQKITTNKAKERYLTPSEVAERLSVAPVTVRKWAQKGMINAFVTPGGHRRYADHEIIRFAEQHNLPYKNSGMNPGCGSHQ